MSEGIACSSRTAAGPLLSILAALVAVACNVPAEDARASDPWVGTFTSEGGVTTVVNESGSVWPGKARLVEEASIGVESGADEYMLGYVQAVYGTDEHIYVIDQQLNLVRRYDENGVFVDQIGRIGQGPGEYTEPGMIEVAPDGRVFVWDPRQRRVLVFGPDGTPLETWPANGAFCCVYPIFFDAGAGETSGSLWMLTYSYDRETAEERFGIQAFGPEGSFGPNYRRRDLEAPTQRLNVGTRIFGIPFTPGFKTTTVGAERFVAGVPDTYRFENHLRGETVRVVEKYWEPVPIDPEHAEWQRKATIASGRRYEPDWTWDGAGMPSHHPAYDDLIGTASGEIWVLRHAPSVRLADCIEEPLADAGSWESTPFGERRCWRNTYIVDVFDAEGRFLGEVETPPDFFSYPSSLSRHIDGDRVVVAIEDSSGTIRVKRYRLVVPD